MSVHQPPDLNVPCLPSFSVDDVASARTAFAAAPAAALGQAWRPAPDPRLRPATVRVGRRADALWVLAELCDDDPFNPVTTFNAPFFQTGDAFELFLRPAGQEAYFEFHVGPANQQFQLRIPSASAFTNQGPDDMETWKIPAPVFQSRTAPAPDLPGWRALVAIPFAAVLEPGGSRDAWHFSFSRYDYTRGDPDPVHSSSSPHARLSFHRQHEWGRLVFA